MHTVFHRTLLNLGPVALLKIFLIIKKLQHNSKGKLSGGLCANKVTFFCPSLLYIFILFNFVFSFSNMKNLHWKHIWKRIITLFQISAFISIKLCYWFVELIKPREIFKIFKLQKQSFVDVPQNKVCNFIKKRLQHRCFPVKFAAF